MEAAREWLRFIRVGYYTLEGRCFSPESQTWVATHRFTVGMHRNRFYEGQEAIAHRAFTAAAAAEVSTAVVAADAVEVGAGMADTDKFEIGKNS